MQDRLKSCFNRLKELDEAFDSSNGQWFDDYKKERMCFIIDQMPIAKKKEIIFNNLENLFYNDDIWGSSYASSTNYSTLHGSFELPELWIGWNNVLKFKLVIDNQDKPKIYEKVPLKNPVLLTSINIERYTENRTITKSCCKLYVEQHDLEVWDFLENELNFDIDISSGDTVYLYV